MATEYQRGRMRFFVDLAKKQGRNQAMCEICQKNRATEVHHMLGRLGPLETDPEFFLGACTTCGRKVHAWPQWAYDRAYSLRRTTEDRSTHAGSTVDAPDSGDEGEHSLRPVGQYLDRGDAEDRTE